MLIPHHAAGRGRPPAHRPAVRPGTATAPSGGMNPPQTVPQTGGSPTSATSQITRTHGRTRLGPHSARLNRSTDHPRHRLRDRRGALPDPRRRAPAGHQAGSTHHIKHGLDAFGVALVAWIGARFTTGNRTRDASLRYPVPQRHQPPCRQPARISGLVPAGPAALAVLSHWR
jgi:hypothetical protein